MQAWAYIGLFQDALPAVDVLRCDPLLYLVVALPLLGISGVTWLLRLKHAEAKELRKENAALVDSIIEANTKTTQAISAQIEVMRNMRDEQKAALVRFDSTAQNILTHLVQIKSKLQNEKTH